MQRWSECRHSPLAPSEAQNAVSTVLSASKRDQDFRRLCGRFPWWEGLEHSWQVRLFLVALRCYKRVLTEIDTDSGLGFAYPVVNANAQSAIKELGQKIACQFRPMTVLSSDQGTYLTAHNVQQWALRYPP